MVAHCPKLKSRKLDLFRHSVCQIRMLEDRIEGHKERCPGGRYHAAGNYLWPPEAVVSPRYVNYPTTR